MSTITTFELLFDARVRDSADRFDQPKKHSAIDQAVKRYAAARPRERAADYAGDGAAFDFDLPTDWVIEFSVIRNIEYPQGERQPVFLQREDWMFYHTTTVEKIRLMSITPPSGKTMRVLYTAPHVVDVSQSTVSSQDEEAVADLAASIGMRDLAATYANTTDPLVQADSVDYRSKSSEWLKLADSLEKRYRQHLGLDKDAPVQAASGFVDVDQASSHGRDKLTHPNRRR